MIVSTDYSYVRIDDSPLDYTKDWCGSVTAAQSASEWMKNLFPNKRSWWISPGGEIIDSGYDHGEFVKENPKLFDGARDQFEAIDRGWVKVGDIGYNMYVEGDPSRKQLESAQDIYKSLGGRPKVLIYLSDVDGKLKGSTFFVVNSVSDLKREMAKQARVTFGRRQAMDAERAWFMSPNRTKTV